MQPRHDYVLFWGAASLEFKWTLSRQFLQKRMFNSQNAARQNNHQIYIPSENK